MVAEASSSGPEQNIHGRLSSDLFCASVKFAAGLITQRRKRLDLNA